ncbi:MAG: hypothetical protein LBS65_05700 [Desulfovibrio sp.]|nr:hypothetical protein [Desulfovibrio sp.]
MIAANLQKWIVFIFISMLAVSFSGCLDQSEQAVAYRKAEAGLDNRSDIVKYKDAAILFESAGDYKDAAKRSKDCWMEYGRFRLRTYEGKPLQEQLEWLIEAKSVFERIDAKAPAATADAAIASVQARIAVQAEQDKGNDDNAIALLEAMDPNDKKALEALKLIRTKDERQESVTRLRTYLQGVPQSTFAPDEKLLFHANLDNLFRTDAFKSREMIADALASMRCYDVIAHAWNKQVRDMRKLSFADVSIKTRLPVDVLLLATIQLAESGDESPEFAEILSLVRGLAITPQSNWNSNPLTRYASLLELYDGRPEWVQKCFPAQWVRDDKSVEYRVLHAPQRVKDALYQKTDLPQGRFTRLYTVLEAKEQFEGFTPSNPLNTGFIVIVDKGTPPPSRSSDAAGQIFDYNAYQSTEFFKVSYAWKNGPTQTKDDPAKAGVAALHQANPMIEELVSRKGKYFCAANPDNARIAIYETYSYRHYGKYQVSGRADMVDVYLPVLDIEVVDLMTKKTLFTDTIRNNANQTYNVPASVQQGDAYIPLLRFNRTGYLEKRLKGVFK